MKGVVLLVSALTLIALMPARAVADPGCDRCTPDAAVSALYDAISVSPNQGWDWARIRSLFAGKGLFASVAPSGPDAPPTISTLDELIDQTEKAFAKSGFIEREYKRETRTFGDMASIYSSFYVKIAASDPKPLYRGLHHFQLLKDRDGWRIVSNVSTIEGQGWRLPDKFAPQ